MGRNVIKFRLVIFATALGLLPFGQVGLAADHQPQSTEVCFTPGGDCTSRIVDTIAAAQHTVLVQAYSFTSAPIAKALVDARKRGIDVRVILDRSQQTERYSGADFLANNGVPVQIDTAHAIAHSKVMVIDGTTVITGSFNFTKAAQERNAENLLVIHDAELAARYAANWQEHAGHSQAYEGRGR